MFEFVCRFFVSLERCQSDVFPWLWGLKRVPIKLLVSMIFFSIKFPPEQFHLGNDSNICFRIRRDVACTGDFRVVSFTTLFFV